MFSGIHKFIVSFFGAVFGVAFILLTIVFLALVVFGLEIDAIPSAADFGLAPQMFLTIVSITYGFFVWLLGFFSVSIVGYYQRKEIIELLTYLGNYSYRDLADHRVAHTRHREEPSL